MIELQERRRGKLENGLSGRHKEKCEDTASGTPQLGVLKITRCSRSVMINSARRTAEAIVNLGWSYLSDSEQDAMASNPDFEREVMEYVRQMRSARSSVSPIRESQPPADAVSQLMQDDEVETLAEFSAPPVVIQEAARVELVEAAEEILAFVHANPTKISALGPQQFEDLVHSIYRNQGFDVERLGSAFSPDGGVDMIAIFKSVELGQIRLAIQCKSVQATQGRKRGISARPIRELAAVLDKFRAHKGILTTTGRFTEKAWQEQQTDFYRIALEDKRSLLAKIDALFPEASKRLR